MMPPRNTDFDPASPNDEGLGLIPSWSTLRRDWLFWTVVVLLLAACIAGTSRVDPDSTTDFNGFWEGGRAVLEGRDIREVPTVRRYLPFFSILMAPLALLPMRAAGAIWSLVEVASLLGTFWIGFLMAGGRGWSRLRRVVIGAGLATAVYWWAHFVMTQINIVAAFFGLWGAWLALRGRPWLGGMSVAIGVSIKVFPGIVFVVFLLTRQWKAALGYVVGFALCCALSVPVFGPTKAYELHHEWLTDQATTSGGEAFFAEGRSLRYSNTSLLAVAGRMMMDVNAGRSRKPFTVNVVNVSPKTVSRVVKGIQLVLLVGLAVLCLRAKRLRIEEVAIALGITAFFLPVAWTFHLAVILPACIVLARAEDRTSLWFLIAAGALQLAVVTPQTRAVGGLLVANLVAIAGVARLAWQSASASEREPQPEASTA